MGRNSKHRCPASVSVEQPIDKVEFARPARSRADRQIAGGLRLASGGESGDLLMRTCTHSIASWARRASLNPFKLSPTTP